MRSIARVSRLRASGRTVTTAPSTDVLCTATASGRTYRHDHRECLPAPSPTNRQRLDDDTTETRGRLLDRAYGPGAADTLQRAMDLGVTHWAGWYDALRTANAPKARLVATLWQRAFGPADRPNSSSVSRLGRSSRDRRCAPLRGRARSRDVDGIEVRPRDRGNGPGARHTEGVLPHATGA